MKIEIMNRNIPGNRVTVERIKEKTRQVVSRISRNVSAVTVKVQALAGRTGGDSREVLVLLQLRNGEQVVVRKRGESVMDLVLDALRQARYAVTKRISRRRQRSVAPGR